MGNNVFGCCDANSTNRNSEISLYAAKNKTNSRNSFQRPSDLFSSIISNIDIDMSNIDAKKAQLQALTNGKALQLKVLNSENLTKGSILTFKPTGLVGSLRNAYDGFTFFGCKKKLKSQIVNDFVIPLKDREMEDNNRGRNFVIFYKIDKDSYWIRDLAKGFGVFVKLDYALILKNNMLINIGESFIVINLLKQNTEHSVRLILKVYGGNVAGEIKSYREIDSIIRIGRHMSCNLKIDDPLLSKIQCTIYYNPISGWTLGDGDIDTQRSSTNGTWLYLNEDFEIYNGMVFKSHQTLFEVKKYLGNFGITFYSNLIIIKWLLRERLCKAATISLQCIWKS
ncbi:unnamed protein product [Blepharisma stoltei]|uniref:FHA domain-containing protein n=1 Tax=Blepharisma stoltei TaxID=1481888 RepID=A0AAU9IIR1_9CILI|nr:unnamed protein product [Blepharisma stoltei]